mgnify:CR=1 FL=1|jgi:hypothetical protein
MAHQKDASKASVRVEESSALQSSKRIDAQTRRISPSGQLRESLALGVNSPMYRASPNPSALLPFPIIQTTSVHSRLTKTHTQCTRAYCTCSMYSVSGKRKGNG